MDLSSILIHGEETENKRQPMLPTNGASSSHSIKGKDVVAVVPDEGAEFRNPFSQEVISLTRRRIEDMLRNSEKIRNSVQFFSAMRLPNTISSISSRYMIPEIVSIGPVNSKKSDHLLQFEDYKWFFLDKFLRRCEKDHRDLGSLILEMQSLEARTRDIYSDYKQIYEMPSEDLIQMMLLDGSFLIELLCYLSRDEIPNDPILVQPFLIPVLARMFLNLRTNFLCSFSRHCSINLTINLRSLPWNSSIFPGQLSVNHGNDQTYASTHSMHCVTELKLSGIKFTQRKTPETFLDIKFKNRVLQIPAITFNEMMKTVLINCVALEQSRERHIKYIADFSNDLGRNTQCVRGSYLSDEIKNVEAYYNNDRTSLPRNYFTTKWRVLHVFAASFLLKCPYVLVQDNYLESVSVSIAYTGTETL
ncbi:uncharacterized protein LOC123204372 [Mangifera indica]|uniref:uncharacterized protein LOC123204372 n=1 Tax=Mangifera indica TaxID=29780 RepID=UPI001CFA6E1D|nr:uncharacterized protein LOC123204372 [Mangifera indica]